MFISEDNPSLQIRELNNTDKKDEEGGKSTQWNGAIHEAAVTGEHLEDRRSAEKVTQALLSRSAIQ